MAWDPEFETAFHPRAIAVVGASGSSERQQQVTGSGAGFIRNFLDQGFEGRIYPINPRADQVLGLRAYPDLASLPEPVDLVIISIPAGEVCGVLRECARLGCKNVHVFAAGFGETGEADGLRLEAEVRSIAEAGGLRLLGPNCMGLNVASAKMWTLNWAPKDTGPVAFLSQSGGHAQFYAAYARGFGIRFSKMISFGNAVRMDSTDFLEYLGADPETRIINLYLEGVKDGRRLTDLVKKINRSKPVIIWKGGSTESGARAAASHTGSLGGEEAVWDAFFKQTGSVRVWKLDEMADVTMTFLHLPPLRGFRAAVVGSGGGNVVSAADVCAWNGLQVPGFTPDTLKALGEFIPKAGNSIKNPIDAEIVLRKLPLLERTLKLVAADPMIDLLIVDQHLDRLQAEGRDQLRQLSDIMQRFARGDAPSKPMAAILYTFGGNPEVREERARLNRELPRAGIPVYRSLDRASRALAKFAAYHHFQTNRE